MKFSVKHLAFVAMAATAVTLTSCGDDDPIDVPNRAPEIRLQNPDGSNGNDTIRRTGLSRNGLVELQLVASDPDGNITQLIVDRNGVLVPLDSNFVNLTIDGSVGPLPENPLLILNAEKSGFTKTIRVRSASAFGDSIVYRFIIRDESGDEATARLVLVNGTPLAPEIPNVLFYNFSDPGTDRPGALDLDGGRAVASRDVTTSELQDQGNASNGSWRKIVAPENGAELRKAPANFDYAALALRTELRDAYMAAGTNLGLSDEIKNGDVYLVKREDATVGTKYYAVRFNTATDETGTRNDRYDVSIKQY